MDGTDGITIALGATTTGFLVKELIAWLRSRNQRTEISPDPLNVRNEKKPVFVTVGECNRRMCEHDQRLAKLDTEIKRSNEAVISKLDELDTRNEERAQQTHRRIDPLIEELGRVRGKMEFIENAAVKATIGGKK
ncbi:MAG: hypothetical protein IIW14_07425 [Kiritimatiellae bacterium]|nr:hypothetical protein [Kiritimatiellia bacterium]